MYTESVRCPVYRSPGYCLFWCVFVGECVCVFVDYVCVYGGVTCVTCTRNKFSTDLYIFWCCDDLRVIYFIDVL